MADIHGKTSGEIAQEVEAQRTRVQATIGEIQERLSPGQLVDELLAYTKTGGGSEFVSNLGRSVSSNPLPVALMGISLAWLMAKQTSPANVASTGTSFDHATSAGVAYEAGSRPLHRYATVSGDLRRTGRSTAEDGRSYSEFADDAGRKYRALTGAAGERAGDFFDDAGASYRGFKDAAGERVQGIRDEAGNLLNAASDWLSDTWDSTSDTVAKVGASLNRGKNDALATASSAASRIGYQAKQSGMTVFDTLHQQPLVGGALAFAVGAAIAAALPHTQQEDRAFGETADALRGKAGDIASEAYAEGKEQVTETVQQVADRASSMLQAGSAQDSSSRS